jgi:ATP-dependent RNA helicase RhlE
MKFENLKLSKNILEAIEYFRFEELTEIQEKVIPPALENKDILACSQTGSGKTAAFLIPLIENISKGKTKGVQALIICPTRELCVQIEEQITGLAYTGEVESCPIFGGSDNTDFNQQKNALTEGNTDIIVATPGRLISHLALGYCKLENLKSLVLDEADEMLNMGFYEDIIKIMGFLPTNRQNMMFSATMPPEIKTLANKTLKNPVIIDLNKSLPAEQIDQYKYLIQKKDKKKLLLSIAKDNKEERIIVFTATKQNVGEVSRELMSRGVNCKGISSSYSQNERSQIVQDFKNNKIKVLVATNLLARGIDISDIGIIINYEIPDNPEDYVHRIGRTARAGKKGVAFSFISADEIYSFQRIEKLLKKTIPEKELPPHIDKGPKYEQKISKNKNKRFQKKTGRPKTFRKSCGNKKRD